MLEVGLRQQPQRGLLDADHLRLGGPGGDDEVGGEDVVLAIERPRMRMVG